MSKSNSAISKTQLLQTLTDVFTNMGAHDSTPDRKESILLDSRRSSTRHSEPNKEQRKRKLSTRRTSITLRKTSETQEYLSVGAQVRILSDLTGAHAGKTGVIVSAGTPAGTWNVTLHGTSTTVLNEPPANLASLHTGLQRERVNAKNFHWKAKSYCIGRQRVNAAKPKKGLAEVVEVAHPSVGVALQRSKKNERMLDAILEEVSFLSARYLDQDQVNATVSAQADTIASQEGHIEVLAKEVYWLSNRLRELDDPERAAHYSCHSPLLTRESSLQEFPVPEEETEDISEWTETGQYGELDLRVNVAALPCIIVTEPVTPFEETLARASTSTSKEFLYQ